ncbi:MAG: DNA polymerase III subunit beta [Patescibacteria group bacterium]|nr:DNA polymerase III subunit beta [Patescibacteria group bacterium]
MKLTILSENLQKNTSLINRIVSQRSQLPILLNILLKTEKGKLQINATDLEIGMQTDISASIEKEGSVTVPAKTFLELIGSLPVEKIVIQAKDGKLEVISKSTRTVFQTTPTDEFPKLFEEKGEEIMGFKSEEIKKDLNMVIFASSQDTGRPALSGVLVKKEKNELFFIATDGYRLSLKRKPITGKVDEWEKPLLIPARILREVISVKQEGGEIKLFVSNKSNQILFYEQDTVLVGRLIDAEFPNYQKIIPSDFGTQVLFDREELLKAVKICSIFARDSANIIKLSFQKEKIVVSANSPSVGENTVEVEARLKGEENEIAFNARYLLDLLGNISEESMVFEMTGPLNPGVFKIQGDNTFLHIIMPIRVQNEG